MNGHTAFHVATRRLLQVVATVSAIALLGTSAGAQAARDENLSARVERAAEVLDELVAVPDKGPRRAADRRPVGGRIVLPFLASLE